MESIRMIGFITYEPNTIILIALIILPVIISFSNSEVYISYPYIYFFIYIVLNIIITNPPAVFKSWERFLLFAVLLMCVGPVLSCKVMHYFRWRCFYFFIWIMAALTSVSCICYFLGINYFRQFDSLNDFYANAGTFGGLFVHSMLLGPMAGISVCFLLYKILKNKRKLYILFLVLSAGALLFSASRAALLATVTGCVSLVLLYFKDKGKGKAFKFLTYSALALAITAPLWDSALDGVMQKNKNNDSFGKYGSRTVKYEARLSEFKQSPLYGIGFAAVDPNGSDVFNTRTGSIEPGSGWFCSLSMTGIIGFAFIVYFMLTAFKNAKMSDSTNGPLLAALVIWFSIHMFFEGYIFAGGGPLCFILWLVIGIATDSKYYPKALTA